MDSSMVHFAGHDVCRGATLAATGAHSSFDVALGLEEMGCENGALAWLSTNTFLESATEDVKPTAPVWQGQKMPGDYVAATAAQPQNLFEALHMILSYRFAAVVEKNRQVWEMKATVFCDYVATQVKVCVHSAGLGDVGSVLLFRHTSKQDVIRFGQLWASVKRHLAGQHIHIKPDHGAQSVGCSSLAFEDDFESGFLDEFEEEDWSIRVESALKAAQDVDAPSRELGLQRLAVWAEVQPDSRVPIAEALGERPGFVKRLLRQEGRLAEQYPLAAMMKFVSMQDHVPLGVLLAEIGSVQGLGLPFLVVNELNEICANLSRRTQCRSISKDVLDRANLTSDVELPRRASTFCSFPCVWTEVETPKKAPTLPDHLSVRSQCRRLACFSQDSMPSLKDVDCR